ncbi:MAG: BatA domain-containing protein [Methanosarcinaceae archaeon]|nr:BatA domain-containing protein [Methanosarcinaceae archaeon]
MPFTTTLALAALASIIPLIILYLLHPKPLEIHLPSLMFMMKVQEEKKRFYSSITRLIKDPLFLTQLLVLIFLSIAAAGPFFTTEEPLSGEHTILIIDSSASMQTDERFVNAVSIAQDYVSKKNSIILAENVPVVILQDAGASGTNDALEKLQPKAAVADLSMAISSGMRLLSDEGGRIIVISDFTNWDGDDPVTAKSLAESYGLKVTFVKVGKSADNVGIINGWLEASDKGYTYNCIIKNYKDTSEQVKVEISANGNDDVSKTMTLDIAPRSTKQFMLTNLGTGITKVKLANADDLMVDNTAYISIPKTTEQHILLISDNGKLPSKTALSLIPNTETTISNIVTSDVNEYDVVIIANKDTALSKEEIAILDGYINKNGGKVVFIASDALAPGVAKADLGLFKLLPVKPLKVTDETDGVSLKVVQATRLTDDMKFDEVAVYKYLNVTPRSDSTTLVATENNIPILTYQAIGDGTVVYLGLNDALGEEAWGNFHNLPEYPVFWAKLIGWLGGAGDISDYNIKTGAITALSKVQDYSSPGGTMSGNRVLYDEVGIYEVAGKRIAVNLYNDRESDTTIDASDVIERSLSKTEPSVVRATTYTAKKDLDSYLIAGVFLLMLLEILIIRKRGEL